MFIAPDVTEEASSVGAAYLFRPCEDDHMQEMTRVYKYLTPLTGLRKVHCPPNGVDIFIAATRQINNQRLVALHLAC